jgi:uncharacterized protein
MDLEELPELATKPNRAILAICGGGYAGLFAAEFLRRLEENIARPSAHVFDLISGTSIGGLLALGLAQGKSAADLSLLLQDIGPKLFARPGFGLFAPKYERVVLESKLKDVFGDAKLSSLSTRILIPAVNLTGGEAIIFRNSEVESANDMKIVDAALATSAAPHYLSPHSSDDRLYADGGLVANSPEAIAIIEATYRFGWSAQRTTMLVVGSTQTCARLPGHMIASQWGAINWLRNGRIFTSTMRAQMSLARQMSQTILGTERVKVADVELSSIEEKSIALDGATAQATQSLKTLAKESFQEFCTADGEFLQQLRAKPASLY